MNLVPIISNLPQEYEDMMDNITKNYPCIQKASKHFYKSHSQFMQFTLDVTCLTPIRSIKHILAEIEKTKSALNEAHFTTEKKKIQILQKEKLQSGEKDELQKEMLRVEIEELSSQIVSTEDYMKAAIRKLSSFVTQYNSILSAIGKKEITEQDYEEDEERYHIMTAFNQALCAARSRGGLIDEGNQIYLFQLGINGAMAQEEINDHLRWEADLFQNQKAPTHNATLEWLNKVADRFQGCTKQYLKKRGMILLDESSLHSRK